MLKNLPLRERSACAPIRGTQRKAIPLGVKTRSIGSPTPRPLVSPVLTQILAWQAAVPFVPDAFSRSIPASKKPAGPY